MKSPVPWNGRCFEHVRSDDLNDYYTGPDGRLTHERGLGNWLACIRDAVFVSLRSDHNPFTEEHDIARAALNGAVEVLRRRVAGDQQWLDALGAELGEEPYG